MINFANIKVGKKYKNIKNDKVYVVSSVGLHSEDLNVLVTYREVGGEIIWHRPIGLFMAKFKEELD